MKIVRVLAIATLLALVSGAHLQPASFLGISEEPKHEEAKHDEAKHDEAKHNEAKPEEAKPEEVKQEVVNNATEHATEEKPAKTEKTAESHEHQEGAVEAQASTDCAKAKVANAAGSQLLYICNAYPDRDSLEVTVGKTPLTEVPMPYMSCAELYPHLEVQNTLRFFVSGLEVGHFAVSALPSQDSTMALVVSRGNKSTQVARFQSHVFAASDSPQVAIFDTYVGAEQGEFSIGYDAEDPKANENVSEPMPLNTAQAVPSGIFSVKLVGLANETKANSTLIAVKKKSYVLLRVGIQADVGECFSQGMVMFPQSTRAELTSSNSSMYMGMALVGLAGGILIAFFACFFRG